MSDECKICYNYTDLAVLNCDHEYCVKCICEYIKVKIEDNETEIICPNEDCGISILYDTIIDIIKNDEDLLEKYMKKFEDHEKINAHMCPSCNKICKRKTTDYHLQCSECDTRFCHVCRKDDHYDTEYND